MSDIPAALRNADTRERLIRDLVRLLTHQQTLYRRLRLLAQRQRTLVLGDDANALLELLSERQRLVDGLSGLNGKIAPYRSHWTEIYHALDDSARRQVSSLLEEANATLGALLKGDGHDCGIFSAKREQVAARLSTIDTGSCASAAYSTAGIGTHHTTTDMKG